MAYKLLDSNGNYMNINGMHKGTIVSPYVYNGMELYNETYGSSRYAPFYSTYRRVKIGTSYYYPSGTAKYYSTAAYEATEVAINGRYYTSSYKDYEVYKDGILVASGSYTSSAADIYVCQKNANTSIIISGEWDSTNYKFIYNITTNATINRENSYYFNNGIVTTSSITMPKINQTAAVPAQYIPISITMPTRAYIESMLPRDCIVMSISSVSYLLTFYKNYSNPNYAYDMWLRTSHSTTTMNPSSLPGSSVCSVSQVSSSNSKTYTLTGTSRLGATYYLYVRQYNTTGTYAGNSSLCSVDCVATATVKYRYFDEVKTLIVKVERTNSYTLPKYTLAQVQSYLPQYGTSTMSNFKYHFTVKNNASSGDYTYYRIRENTTVVYGPYYLGLGNTTTGSRTYTADMTYALTLRRATASDGTYNNGSDTYISFPNEDGAHYLEITYTWTPS